MVEVFSTAQLPPARRAACWREIVCAQLLPVHVELGPDHAPVASVSSASVGVLRIRDVVGGAHVYRRREHDIRRGEPMTVQVALPLTGAAVVEQDGREALLEPGGLTLCDSARPFSIVMRQPFRWLVFVVPKAALRCGDADLGDLTARALSSHQGICRVATQFLRSLAVEAERLEDSPGAVTLGEAAADLVAAMIGATGAAPGRVADPDSERVRCLEAWIVEHHGDPDLAPQTVAAAHDMSVRRLHALLAPTGRSVGERIRQARLVAIRRDLADPRLAGRPIARIAAAHGMPNASAFARTFRAWEGRTPREFRDAALEAAYGAAHEAAFAAAATRR